MCVFFLIQCWIEAAVYEMNRIEKANKHVDTVRVLKNIVRSNLQEDMPIHVLSAYQARAVTLAIERSRNYYEMSISTGQSIHRLVSI